MTPARMFALAARILAMTCGLNAISVAGVQTLPSYSRAITPPTFGTVDWIVAVVDLNGDGRQDLLVGGAHRVPNSCTPDQRPLAPPLRAMVSNGDGTFRDATAEVITRTPGAFFNPARPIPGVVADFNNDGRPDIAVFDYGTECGQITTGHTFYGYPPILLLSESDGKWSTSNGLSDAISSIHASRFPQYSGPNLRVLGASAGDINGDGRVDLFVESCGGENVCSHFLMNNGDGTFTVDLDRATQTVLHNLPEFWRQQADALVDMNGDGRLDLVMGQSKTTDPTHVNESSLVIFNDGTGRFPLANRVLLPEPDYARGFTGVGSLAVLDLDGDGRKDLILVHRRNIDPDYFGRYVQVLMNRGSGNFVDETAVRVGDQSATTPLRSPIYSENLNNQVYAAYITDVNSDGSPDLALNSQFYIGPDAPLVHLNNGTGQFTVMDPNVFTRGDLYFGENSVPLDLNGDGIVDFVHTDITEGPDGTFGTADDVTRLIALIGGGIGAASPTPPGGVTASTSGSLVTLAWTAPFSGPPPIGYVIEAGSGPGLRDLASVPRGPATTFAASGVAAGRYYVRVRTVTSLGTSTPSPDVIVTVGAGCSTPPVPPTASSQVSGTTVTVSWNPSAGATSYVLEAGSGQGLTNIANTDTGSTATSFTATGVRAGTYFVRVRSRNACGTSNPSNEVTAVVG